MNLSLLILLPLITAIGILFSPGVRQVKLIALTGSIMQLGLACLLLIDYWHERQVNHSPMLFEFNYTWFAALHINYHVGVDGISIAMILLTASVVVAGILVSWATEKLSKEFFFLLILLSLGAYGFFISLDLFTLFFFLEIAVIPKFLLIGIWGSGKKEYSAMKLALMLMAGSALVFVGLMGLYNTTQSFDILQISRMQIPIATQKFFFPFAFFGLRYFCGFISFSYLGTRRACFSAHCRFYVPGRYFHEAGWLWLFTRSYFSNARCGPCLFVGHHLTGNDRHYLWRFRYHDADRS